jgi:hypothetical protein
LRCIDFYDHSYDVSIVNLPAYDVLIIDCTPLAVILRNLILCSSKSALFLKIFQNFTSRKNKRVITTERVGSGIISDLLVFMSGLQTICFLKHTYKANVSRKVVHGVNTFNAELNPICHLLALIGAHHILHVSRIRVNAKWLDLWRVIVNTVVTVRVP